MRLSCRGRREPGIQVSAWDGEEAALLAAPWAPPAHTRTEVPQDK